MDYGGEALIGFIVARGDAAKRFEFAEEIFNQMAPTVHMEITGNGLLAIGFGWDDGEAAPFIQLGPQPIDIEGLVGEEGLKVDILDQRFDADAIMALTR